ncbi:helix-turn-helix domain-containing protein [Streptomyces sp. NPDC051453]|uniref:helix-turn-helix domain-containing protein n=1 Tax=Streptomyces sp. NPDC051453 TaxID=3154941 RepID=UPI00341D29CF
MHHVRRFLYQSGGVRLTPQRRSERHLTASEREEISRGIAAGESARQLARRLGRSASTVSREIARNGGRDRYRAASADAAAYTCGRRPKQAKLIQRAALRALVEARLALCWSPEQIAGWLRRQFPGDTSMQISHEAIYLSLYDPRRRQTQPRATKRPLFHAPGIGQLTRSRSLFEPSRPRKRIEDRQLRSHFGASLEDHGPNVVLYRAGPQTARHAGSLRGRDRSRRSSSSPKPFRRP